MLGFRAVASALLLMFLATGCNSQLRLPEDLQIYFPQKSTAAFNMGENAVLFHCTYCTLITLGAVRKKKFEQLREYGTNRSA